MRTVAETPIFNPLRVRSLVRTGASGVHLVHCCEPGSRCGYPRNRRLQEGPLVARWHGKRGGARVIYFLVEDETVWLLIVYTKAKYDALPASFLAKLRQGVEDAL